MTELQHDQASGLETGLVSHSSGKSERFTSNVQLFVTSDLGLASDFGADLEPLEPLKKNKKKEKEGLI